ncbi:hypothetical protein CAPI_06215 [Corynebacterium capitovis DSM 44611]|uniref:hypothetical protein n=1 Tax=Corynebacterium capitovis TaxID=131081 RepID=UPI00035F29F6|nr:hypothetical protein [Corynebacterium capitovis]WKD57785.1 hypothetical protein CAPI_06215 [Corynebacterium capitovis DSM 44611]
MTKGLVVDDDSTILHTLRINLRTEDLRRVREASPAPTSCCQHATGLATSWRR